MSLPIVEKMLTVSLIEKAIQKNHMDFSIAKSMSKYQSFKDSDISINNLIIQYINELITTNKKKYLLNSLVEEKNNLDKRKDEIDRINKLSEILNKL